METVNNRALLDRYLEKSRLMEHFSTCKPQFLLRRYQPGELLTNPFSPSPYLPFIVDGELLLYDMPDEESTIMLETTYTEVNILGKVELLDELFTPFFVEARTDVYTLAFYTETYRQALLNDPVFLRYLCSNLAKKLNGAVASSANLTLRQRVERSLRHAEIGESLSAIGHLAKSLNVSSRQLQRVLKEFCEAGVLEHEKKGCYAVRKKPE